MAPLHSLALLALHLLGLLAVVRFTHQPLWLALAVVVLIQPLIVSLRLRCLHPLPESLAPLGLAYTVLLLRLLIAFAARVRGLTSGPLVVPEPWAGLLSLNTATALSGLWAVLAQAGPTAQAFGKPVRRVSLHEIVVRHWRALSFCLRLDDRPIPLRHALALLSLHLLGLSAIVRFTGQSLWLSLAAILLVQPLVVSLGRRGLRLLPESLAPLGLAYAVLILRLLIATIAYAQGLTPGWPVVPGAWERVLNLDVAATLSGLWALLVQAGPTTEALGRRADWKSVLGYTLAVLALAWSVVTLFTIRTKGVTGSDPYSYVQMGVDIAQHGTPLHTFDHAPWVAERRLPLEPVVPVGYCLPNPQTGVAATVWAPGHSALLAVGYWLAGETGLYVTTPVLGLASLAATWWLCHEVLRPWPKGRKVLAAGVAVFLLATSREYVDRLLVPMADVSSQLFTTLAVCCALRAARGRTLLFACLSGLCLGAAFAARYTQVLTAASLLFLFLCQHRQRSWRALALATACCGAAAWLAASPVLWYHQVAFGNPFSTCSSELEAFGWASVPGTSVRMVKEFFRLREFFYVIPFLGWGAVRLWRDFRRAAAGLLMWLVVILFFHLFYNALRLRDLLSVFPVLALWAGVGMADLLSLIRRIGRPTWRRMARVLGFCAIIALLWARSNDTLCLPVPPMHFNMFGYLLSGQRAAFDTLANLTPPDAIVAASLNSGPIELYADRDAIRPAGWSRDEWLDFVAYALDDGYRVYLLEDGVEMREPLRAVQSRYQIILVSSLPVPYFHPGGGSVNLDVPLYEVAR